MICLDLESGDPVIRMISAEACMIYLDSESGDPAI